MQRVKLEEKITGINIVLIFIAVTAVFAILAYVGGELINLSNLGFEVIFPFLMAIAVGEWGKIRSDSNFDIIASQSKSLFKWIVIRFTTVFVTGTIFALMSMAIVSLIRNEAALYELILLYLPPAFFLSTLCTVFGTLFSGEHIATLITGSFWILSMLARSMLRFPGVEYFYLFIRFAGDENGIWLINKAVLAVLGLGLWIVIYLICKKRVFAK